MSGRPPTKVGGVETFVCPAGSRFAGKKYMCHGGTLGCMANNSDCCNADNSAPACPSLVMMPSPPMQLTSLMHRPEVVLEMDICLKVTEDVCEVLGAACEKNPDSALCPKIQAFCSFPT